MTVIGTYHFHFFRFFNSCSPLSYSFDVFELLQGQSLSETVIGQVEATDADSGTFGQIEYSLSAPSSRYL